MPGTVTEQPVVDEQIWRAWIQKGRRQEAATNRKLKLALGVVLALLALGGVYYKLAVPWVASSLGH